jgi:hypothetical protein
MLTVSMTLDQPTPPALTPEANVSTSTFDYAKLDFNAPATVGVVLYESQRLFGAVQGEIHRGDRSLRADMAAMDQSLRADMASMEKSLRADMAAMEKSLRTEMAALGESLRAEIAQNTRVLLTAIISLHGISLAATAAVIRFL